MKKLNKKTVVSALSLACVALLTLVSVQESMAATTTTNTTLWIIAGSFSFTKDTTAGMNTYFGHAPNASGSVDLGSYASSVSAVSAASAGNHRFTVTDLLGSSFTVTIQSSALTTTWGTIAASAIGYTGTAWLGTGQALVAAPTSAVDIGTAPVTFVSRTNANGLSQFSQEITLKVAIPAAQKPGSYTGVITFTY